MSLNPFFEVGDILTTNMAKFMLFWCLMLLVLCGGLILMQGKLLPCRGWEDLINFKKFKKSCEMCVVY